MHSICHHAEEIINGAELQTQQHRLNQRKEALMQDVAVQWNSTLQMIERLTKNKETVLATLEEPSHKLTLATNGKRCASCTKFLNLVSMLPNYWVEISTSPAL